MAKRKGKKAKTPESETPETTQPESEVSPPEFGTSPMDRRAQVMAEIEKSRDTKLEEEGFRAPTEAEEEHAPPQPPEAAEDSDDNSQIDDATPSAESDAGDDGAGNDTQPAEEQAETPTPEPQVSSQPEPTYVVMTENGPLEVPASQIRTKTVIDGQEREVAGDELHRGFQIESAARSHLEYANRALTQLQQYEQALQQRYAQAQQQPPPQPAEQPQQQTQPQPSSNPAEDVDISDLLEAFDTGSDQERAKALKDAVLKVSQAMGGAAQAPTPEEITSQVLERVDYNQALARFNEQYPDLTRDPAYRILADQLGEQLYHNAVAWAQRTGNARPSYWEIMDEAGRQTRQRLKQYAEQSAAPAGAEQQPGSESRSQPQSTAPAQAPVNVDQTTRTEMKRAQSTTPQPRAQSPDRNAAQPQRPVSELQKRRNAIAELQKSRGQAV